MSQSKLAKNTMALSIGTLMTNLLQFLMVPMFSSWLSTSDYGSFDLCITYAALALPLINLASGEAVFRFCLDCEDKEKCTHISNGLAIITINSVVLSVIAVIASIILKRGIILPFLVLLLSQTLNSYCQSYLRAIKRLPIYSVSSIVTTVFICLFVTFFIKGLNWTLDGIILGYAMGYLAGDLFIIVVSKYWRYFSWNTISAAGMKILIEYSYPLIPNNVCWWVINTSNRVVINVFLGSAFNGIYAIANKVPNVCASVFGMFNISWQESASEVVEKSDRKMYYNSVYNNTVAVLISLCTGVLSLNWFLYDFLFDVRYSEASLYTPILILAIIFNSVSQFYGGIMISLKQPKANGTTTILGAAVNLSSHILLIKYIGMYAAAVSTLLSNVALCMFRSFVLRKEVKCTLEKKTMIYILFFIYMFVFAYVDVGLIWNIVNVLIAIVIFIIINRGFIVTVLQKILNRKK